MIARAVGPRIRIDLLAHWYVPTAAISAAPGDPDPRLDDASALGTMDLHYSEPRRLVGGVGSDG